MAMLVAGSTPGFPTGAAAPADLAIRGTTAATAIDLTEDDGVDNLTEDDGKEELMALSDPKWPGLEMLNLLSIANAIEDEGNTQTLALDKRDHHPHHPPANASQKDPVPSKRTISRQLRFQNQVNRRTLRKLRPSGPDLQIIDSHRGLAFWKRKYFQELKIDSEFQLASDAALVFEKSKITTVVPHRYMRQKHLPRRRRLKPKLPAFPGIIEILPAMKAIRQAYEEHTSAKQDIGRLVLWTDGSASNKHRGFAVVWRRTTAAGWGPWETAGFKAVEGLLDSTSMESLAVIKALDKAREIIGKSSEKLKAIAIYTDCQSSLTQPHKSIAGRMLREQIVKKARLLKRLGATVSLHWCPGHSKVPGNELADMVASIASYHTYGNMPEIVDLSDDEEDYNEDDGWMDR